MTRPPIVDRFLKRGQYVAQEVDKTQIVLHHTVGGTAQSTLDWWNSNSSRTATAFIIDRDGTIIRAFPETMWAYHIFRSPDAKELATEKASIGIELASEGGLTMRGGTLYAYDGRARHKGEHYDHGTVWRGFRYFDAYETAQLASLYRLVDWLCAEYSIRRAVPANETTYSRSLFTFAGIIGHHHVRADKSDVHPGFPWHELMAALAQTPAPVEPRPVTVSAPSYEDVLDLLSRADLDERQVAAVYEAWTDPGPDPARHVATMQTLRREWPALGRALDALSSLPH